MQPSGESRNSGTEIRYKVCPACGHEKWSVSQSPLTGAWYCYKCEAKGMGEATAPHPTLLFRARPSRVEWNEIALPDYQPLSDEARAYLLDRGVTHPGRYGIVQPVGTTRLLFPYLGPEGKVIFWSTRSYIPDKLPKYVTASGKHPLYVLPGWEPHPGRVMLVEGIFDAIMTHEATGLPTIALGGKVLPWYLKADLRFLAPGRKTVLLDSDAFRAALRLCAELTDCKMMTCPRGVDPADMFGKDEHTERAKLTMRWILEGGGRDERTT